MFHQLQRNFESSAIAPNQLERRRAAIDKFEEYLWGLPNKVEGDLLPARHAYSEGMYYREFLVPTGFAVVGRIHKYPHFAIFLEGEMMLADPNMGVARVKAPVTFVSFPGTKRAALVLQQIRFANVFNLDRIGVEFVDDLVEMRKRLSVDSYSNLGESP